MLTLEQARDTLDQIAKGLRITRDEHTLVNACIMLLYNAAKDRQEDVVEAEVADDGGPDQCPDGV